MSSDFLAAKLGDELVHTSLFADFISGLAKGAIYAAVGIAAVAAVAATGGAAIAVGIAAGAVTGFVLGEAIDAVSDAAGDLADSVASFLGLKGPPEGLINSGSPNVNVKSKPAARAAGKIPADIIRAELDAKAQAPADTEPKAIAIAKRALSKAWLLTPMGMGQAIGNSIVNQITGDKTQPLPADAPKPVPSPKPGFWEGMLSPVVAAKHPFASPMDNDTITCTKWHIFPELFLAEGSKTVRINSQPACRNGDRSTCEAKISHTQYGASVRIGGERIVVRDIKSGKNPFVNLAGEIVGSVLSGAILHKIFCGKKIACMLLGEAVGAAVGAMIGGVITSAITSGHPVHIPTGAKLLAGEEESDFTLDGYIPIYWQRLYNSRNRHVGVLGQGWTLPFEIQLHIDERDEEAHLVYTDASGRELQLAELLLGQSVHFADEGFTLWRSQQNIFMLETDEGIFSIFEPNPLRKNGLRLAKQMDRHQNTLHYRYDDKGLVTHIYDEYQQRTLSLHYTSNFTALSEPHHPVYRLTEVRQCYREHSKTRVIYRYNARAELIEVQDADNIITRQFSYETEQGLMLSHRYVTGLQANYRWTLFNSVVAADNSVSAEWYVTEHWLTDKNKTLEHYTIDYDITARKARVTQDDIGTTEHHWDKFGQILDYTDVMGERWQFRWSPAAKLTEVINPLQGKYCYAYDERGNLIKETTPAGEITNTEWDRTLALPVTRILPGNHFWRYEYNTAGDLTQLTDPKGFITGYQYDDVGNRQTQTDAKGNGSHYAYNLNAQLTQQRDCSGQITRLHYDDWGNLTSRIDAQGTTTQWHYSDAGRLQQQRLSDNRSTRYHYDKYGLLAGMTDPAGQQTSVYRNARGQVIQKTDPKQQHQRFDYDKSGRLSALHNEKGEMYHFSYDAAHRVQETFDFSGQHKRYVYDALGHIIKQTHLPNPSAATLLPAIESTFERDEEGRLLARNTPDYRTAYDYSPEGVRIKRFTQSEWQTAQQEQRPATILDELYFEYDERGQLTAEHNHGGSYQYQYDPLGNLLNTIYPDKQELHHFYYGSGHLLQSELLINGQKQTLAEYKRDRLHRETSRLQGRLYQHTEYDATGRIRRKSASHQAMLAGYAPLIDNRFFYDKTDNLIQTGQSHTSANSPFAQGDYQTEYYQYDAVGQLSKAIIKQQSTPFNYDEAGNWLPDENTLVSHNRLTLTADYRNVYDGFGRLHRSTHRKTKQERLFSYNSEHQLTEVWFKHHPEFSKATYQYDALGRRTHKQLHRHDQRQPEIITFHWQGLKLSGEQSSLRPHNSTTYLYTENSYEPQARIDKTANNWNIYYYHTALNGLPQALTDYGGHIVWKGRYSVWGKLQNETSELTQPQNLRFQGQYYDTETGLHYNTFRYYDPDSGHFTQQDPIGLAGGINQYAYAPNPLMWIDPLGLSCKQTKKGRIKEAQLPTKGRIRYVPPKDWKPTTPLPKKSGGFLDRFGNTWTKGPSRTAGEPFEWDVQLSNTGKQKIGWVTRDGSHANISLGGEVTHK